MTALTATQIVAWLQRPTIDMLGTVPKAAATLIEQQAEQIAALRKVIEDEPHDNAFCSDPTDKVQECYCWKSKALPMPQVTSEQADSP